MEEVTADTALDVWVYIQNPYGAVSVADGRAYLTNWLGGESLSLGKAKYVREPYGRVAKISFSNVPTGHIFRLDGVDLCFIDGPHSYDAVVVAPVPGELSAVVASLLGTWGT